MQQVDKLGTRQVDLIPFQTHIYLLKGHPLAKKKKTGHGKIWLQLPTVRLQEKMEASIIQRILSCQFELRVQCNRRATLNGILERTDAYATRIQAFR